MLDILYAPGSSIFGMQILLPGIPQLAATPSNRSNSYQPEKPPPNPVGARVAEWRKVGLYGRPPWVAMRRWLVAERAALNTTRQTL